MRSPCTLPPMEFNQAVGTIKHARGILCRSSEEVSLGMMNNILQATSRCWRTSIGQQGAEEYRPLLEFGRTRYFAL